MGAKCVRAVDPEFDDLLTELSKNADQQPSTGSRSRPSDFDCRATRCTRCLRDESERKHPQALPREDPNAEIELKLVGPPLVLNEPMLARDLGNKAPPPPSLTVVTLNIYDLGTFGLGHAMNRFLRPLGAGLFHCGVEVYRSEWSFSDTVSKVGAGLYASKPCQCSDHTYAESVQMGSTSATEAEVLKLIDYLQQDWPVSSYDTLHRNCCHFCNEFCQRLGVGPIPHWLNILAHSGAAVVSTADVACCQTICCADKGYLHRTIGPADDLVDDPVAQIQQVSWAELPKDARSRKLAHPMRDANEWAEDVWVQVAGKDGVQARKVLQSRTLKGSS